MGLRGPAPKPTRLKLLQGNPGHRPINGAEPQFEHVKPKCPAHLSKEARKYWKELTGVLMRAGVLTDADKMALGNLCQAYATMANAQELLNKSSILIKTGSGYLQQSPLFAVITTSMDLINKLCREFGLTPSARTRLQGNAPPKPESKWADTKPIPTSKEA